MSRMTIGVIGALILGAAVGVIGGIVLGEPWFHGGEIVFVIGLIALWALALWKGPPEIVDLIDAESGGEEVPNGTPAVSQFEAQRRPSTKAAPSQK